MLTISSRYWIVPLSEGLASNLIPAFFIVRNIMILSKEMLFEGKSRKDDFNCLQIEALGDTKKTSGWKRRLIGKEITKEQYEIFLKLKDSHYRKKDKIVEEKKANDNKIVIVFDNTGNTITLTKELIEYGCSSVGGWTIKQLNVLGVERFKKGWKEKLIGKKISTNTWNLFVGLKGEKKEKKSRYRASIIPINDNLKWEEQYKHPNWQKVRLSVFSRDDFTCKICGNNNKQLHVHHRSYSGRFIWDSPLKTMITVCEDCHYVLHNRVF